MNKEGKMQLNLRSKLLLLASSLLLLLIVIACGGGSSTPTPTPSLSISPTASTVTVGGAAVSFTANLSNSTETINWSLSGPGSIPASATGSTVSYTPPTSGGAASATLTATAGSVSASATITINAAASTPSLTVTPSSLTVTVGEPATPFTATLENSNSVINWSLTGAGSIPTGATGATVEYTPPTSGGAGSATLTATAGSLTASATITVEAQATVTVNGEVLRFDGSAAPGVNVQIDDAAGSTGTAVTGSSGAFSISNVQTPYTLSVVPPAGTDAPQTWPGVTINDPTVVVNPFGGPGTFCPAITPGTLRVNFLGLPVATGNRAVVVFIAEGISRNELESNVSDVANAGDTFVDLTIPFDRALCQTQVTGKVVYLEFDGSDNFIRTGVVDATVTTGNPAAVSVAKTNAVTKPLQGNVTFPAGITDGIAHLIFEVGSASYIAYFNTINTGSPTFTFPAPEIDGINLRVRAQATPAAGLIAWRYSDIVPTLPATVDLSLPSIISTNQPSGAIGNEPTPTFSYTAVSDTNLYTAFINSKGSAATQLIGSTSSTSLEIPALPAPARLDVGTTAAPRVYEWVVNAIKVRAGGDADTMLDGRQVKKLYLGGDANLNPTIISGGAINLTPTEFTLP